jgi:hypothetical protein
LTVHETICVARRARAWIETRPSPGGDTLRLKHQKKRRTKIKEKYFSFLGTFCVEEVGSIEFSTRERTHDVAFCDSGALTVYERGGQRYVIEIPARCPACEARDWDNCYCDPPVAYRIISRTGYAFVPDCDARYDI